MRDRHYVIEVDVPKQHLVYVLTQIGVAKTASRKCAQILAHNKGDLSLSVRPEGPRRSEEQLPLSSFSLTASYSGHDHWFLTVNVDYPYGYPLAEQLSSALPESVVMLQTIDMDDIDALDVVGIVDGRVDYRLFAYNTPDESDHQFPAFID